ncbi:SIS domain-containing protein, partial [Klebsiella pneumoniae]
MNTKEIINAVAKEIEDKGGIRQVFLVACGGSLVDMYPAKYFLDSEATKLHVGMYTANEFVYATPKTLGENSLVIVCSHGGNTPESVAAAKLAQQHQAHTITLTHNAQ